ncbi:hypothetical protein EMCRGX_G011121 [Ephydatia muelleri]
MDSDVRSCFSKCFSIDLSEAAWCQSQLSLRFGGLGLHSLPHHSSAAFIASFCSSGFATTDNHHLMNAVNLFVSSSDAISSESSIESPPSQRSLSHKLDSLSFSNLYDLSSPANKARLLSASASLATSWVSVLPSGLASRMLWSDGIPTAFDITVTSPLTPVSLQEASVTPGTAALLAERRKHQANDPKCHMLGWKCTPLAVESYGSWGSEARQVFSHLASRLSFGLGIQKPKILVEMYGKLNIALVRCNARALLSRACNLV